ncbi:MAG: hypothetical protein K2O24_04745 [Muribaculaceae bacterium]|nr:hypothetical protein [Muribaculaceae bacterium]
MFNKILAPIFSGSPLTKYASLLIVLMVITWLPLEGRVGFGIIKLGCLISGVIVLLIWAFAFSRAMFMGVLYVGWQLFVASLHPATFRFSTIGFSIGLVFTYVCFYNLLYERHVFTVRRFIMLLRWIMMAFFVFCILQQICLAVGITIMPAVNLIQVFDRGIGCNSLSMEPSTFARTMLVCYYAYLKCTEYVRGDGPWSFKDLFNVEHRWVTIRFLWMMCTMGSGTAFVCLIALSLYFVRKNNWYYMLPILIGMYVFVLPEIEDKQLQRATNTIDATTTLNQEEVQETDGSAGSRISPMLNSLSVDLTDPDTWFGHGIDYTVNNNMIIEQTATLFDDYGLIFYIISLVFDFTCAYRFWSLGCVFMFMGIAGGAGTNIHYTWTLMMIMTGIRYFYDNRFDLDLSDDEEDEDEEEDTEEEIENAEYARKLEAAVQS